MSDVELHPLVQAIAMSFSLEQGKLVLEDALYAAHETALKALQDDEKKPVLASLIALAARFLRDGKGGADAAAAKLTTLAAVIIGDPEKAKALFAKVR